MRTTPGATNVIAGEARLSLEVRHHLDEVRKRAVEDLVLEAEEIAKRRGLSVRSTERMNQPAIAMDSFLSREIEAAIRKTGCSPHRTVSGAGHDAMIMAEKVPAAMIFLRTPGGISHDPAESVAVDDVAKAIECGLHLLQQLAAAPNSRRGRAVHNSELDHLGQTRSSQHRNHLLLTPDTFVRTPLPGMKQCIAVVHAGTALGAAFTQYTAEFEAGGELGATSAQRFLYVLEGEISFELGQQTKRLIPRGYAYIPQGSRIESSLKKRAAWL